jgi:asparagine synthase (glutamine-hydrolysing)
VVQIGGAPHPVVASETLDRMTDAMTHRGPDDRGTHVAPGIALGVRRLSIVDVAGGHQPFANEDGRVWAVQNGELYNHDELRDALRADGHSFQSRCDTEILPHLYERDGVRVPELLRGKFAIAVWDAERRRCLVARDRLGVKPLYWARAGELVVFASELRSVLASGLVDGELDYEAIDAYLTLGFVPGPRTPLAAVQKLMPGHRLVVDGDGVRTEAYWRHPVPAPDRSLDQAEHAERLLAALDESVRLRLMSDVPLGAMLSGGLDSSVIVALMARHMTQPVKTFSVGFAGGDSELGDARAVAAALGADHHELELPPADDVDLVDLLWRLDEPIADLSALGFLALSELARKHVTVALAGQGADELLGGYRSHRAAAAASAWQRIPRALRPPLPGRTGRVLGGDSVGRLHAAVSRIGPAVRAELVRGPLAAHDGDAARRAIAACVDGLEEPLLATLHAEAQLGLVDDMLAYFDKTSMAHSLEVRVPFLDHHVVELAATIPPELKVRRLRGKHLLRVAARGLVPDFVIDKPKKGFFNGAVEGWLRGQAPRVARDYLLAPDARTREFLDRRAVERILARQAETHGARLGPLLLSLLFLEVWLDGCLPRALAVAPVRERIAVPAA